MKRAFALVAALSAVTAPGCAPATVAYRSTATLKAEELPSDTTALLRLTDAELEKRTHVGMENALVVVDKLLAAEPKSFDAAWRGARACGYLTEDFPNDKKTRAHLAQRGTTYAKIARDADATRVEGHYWLGINLGQLANANASTELVPQVVESAKEASRLDEKYEFAGPLRLLGSVYAKAPEPPISVGDREEGVRTLDRAVQLFPGYPQNVLHLGDALLQNDKLDEAERRYQQVLNAPANALWSTRLDAWKKDAQDGVRRVAKKREILKSGGNNSPF